MNNVTPVGMGRRSRLLVACISAALLLGVPLTASAFAEEASPRWTAFSVAMPENFAPGTPVNCSESTPEGCDVYRVVVKNQGGAATSAGARVRDVLPAGVEFVTSRTRGGALSCGPTGNVLECEDAEPLASGGVVLIECFVTVKSGVTGGMLANAVTVEGGEASTYTATSENPVSGRRASFGFEHVSLASLTESGAPSTEAGGHPAAVTADIYFPSYLFSPPKRESTNAPVETVKDMVVELPRGFVGNPTAAAQCPESALSYGSFTSDCPPASQVGVFSVVNGAGFSLGPGSVSEGSRGFPVYEMQPNGLYPAEFGINFEGNPVFFYATVSPKNSYAVQLTSTNLPRGVEFDGISMTLWGTPASSSHTPARELPESEEAGAQSGVEPKAFITNPTTCTQEPLSVTVRADTWERPGVYAQASAQIAPSITGCESAVFGPLLRVSPSTSEADEPSGYGFELTVPQSVDLAPAVATPNVQRVSVELPPGTTLNPSAAQGLVGCPLEGPNGLDPAAETGPESGEALPARGEHGHCPAASTIGSVEAVSPLLSMPLKGHLYLAQPQCGGSAQPACTAEDALNGKLFSVFLEVEGSGVDLKLAGTASVNPSTGQVTTVFQDTPQLPYEKLKLLINGGPFAPLANPQTCGLMTATGSAVPWSSSGAPAATLSSTFGIDWNGAGGACPSSPPFAPAFSANSTSTQAGGQTTFTLSVGRKDREGYLGGLRLSLPPGLIGDIAAVEQCPEPAASRGECAAGSEVGQIAVGAGAGSAPLWLTGKVFLTGPYDGAPFGLSIVVPAVAGPFNLGDEVVRAGISVDPKTAVVSVTSATFPQSRDGVPFRIKELLVDMDRPGFLRNPTSCAPLQVTATASSTGGAEHTATSPFGLTGCKSLPFKPKLAMSTTGATSKLGGASLKVEIKTTPGEANIAKTKVDLPIQLPSRQETLEKACAVAVFEANPANCPEASDVGYATAVTPILKSKLAGPAYLVSHGGTELPDLDIVLQGENITLVETGKTTIKKGITASAFKAIPDAPISSFTVTLPEKRHSALASFLPASAKRSMCGQNLVAPTVLVGQNGVEEKQNTRVTVEGCPGHIHIQAHSAGRKQVTITVYVPGAGHIQASGRGLQTKARSVGQSELVTFRLSKTRGGALSTQVVITFKPTKGGKQTKKLGVRLSA
jgi:uncharacterized repeat protein (TIGR01451 family)